MLKMGIVGLGKMGAIHTTWLTPENQLELVAICEKNEARLQQIKDQYEVPIYQDLGEFLKVDMDFAIVVTTHESHEAIVVECLNAGKNVIVEKPMSMTYASTLRMIEAAEQNAKHLFVHQSSRWDRDFLFVKETIQSGLLGDILMIQSKVMLCDEGWPHWGIEGAKNPWRVKAAYGGGMLLDWGPHLVDEILLLMDKDPVGVYGALQSGLWSDEVDDYFFCMLKFDNDLVCQIECGNNARLDIARWYVTGTNGTLEVKGRSEPVWDQIEMIYQNDKGEQIRQHTQLIGVTESGIEGGFYRDLVPFLNGEISEFVSMYEASKGVKVLEMVKRSHEEGRFVRFDE
jgi:scyllo-inositol 2-dehydrogenase (NADP+)